MLRRTLKHIGFLLTFGLALSNQMKIKRVVLQVAAFILFGIFCFSAQGAVTFTTLFSFSGTNGIEPEGQLVQTEDGYLYGTARETTLEKWGNANFGYNGHGTIFRITTNGDFSTITNFSISTTNGANPRAGLILGKDGNFYGTTTGGGVNQQGTVFRLTTNGLLTILASFIQTNGGHPVAGLLQAKDDFLIGTTFDGGIKDPRFPNVPNVPIGWGTVYSIDTQGILKTLIFFDKANGARPSGNLILGNDGNFFGTTGLGGIKWLREHKMTNEFCDDGFGTVFKMTRNGELKTLIAFNGFNGQEPTAIAISPDGSIYGITSNGGSQNTAAPYQESWIPFKGNGTIFKIPPTGEFKTLVLFYGANGKHPSSFIMGKNGIFYGATASGGANDQGTIFELTPSGKFKILYSFKEPPGSSFPNRANTVIQGTDGNLYGTTARFGLNGSGSVFRLTMN